jgi:hypothetical protein
MSAIEPWNSTIMAPAINSSLCSLTLPSAACRLRHVRCKALFGGSDLQKLRFFKSISAPKPAFPASLRLLCEVDLYQALTVQRF